MYTTTRNTVVDPKQSLQLFHIYHSRGDRFGSAGKDSLACHVTKDQGQQVQKNTITVRLVSIPNQWCGVLCCFLQPVPGSTFCECVLKKTFQGKINKLKVSLNLSFLVSWDSKAFLWKRPSRGYTSWVKSICATAAQDHYMVATRGCSFDLSSRTGSW